MSDIERSIKEKIEAVGVPLKDWDIKINYGIKTGCNEAFIIDGATKDRLIAEDPKSAEIIRPILRGRDIKRYSYDFKDMWLIASHNGYTNDSGNRVPRIDIENYPAIKAHLDQYWDVISVRTDKGETPYNLRNCAYMDDFNKQKIMFQEMVQKPSFFLDEADFLCLDTGRIITGANLIPLLTVLNSKLFFFAIRCYYGGGGLGSTGIRMKHTFFEVFPAPPLSNNCLSQLSLLYLQIPIDDNMLDEIERSIDMIIYDSYGLQPEEIEFIRSQ